MLIASAFFEVDAKVPTRTAAVAFLINLIAFNMFKLIFIYMYVYSTCDMCVLCIFSFADFVHIYASPSSSAHTQALCDSKKKKIERQALALTSHT